MNKKICFIATFDRPILLFLLPFIKLISEKNEVTIICKNADNLKKLHFNKNVSFKNISFSRKISLVNDILSFFQLFFHLIFNRYQIVHSIMPKTGLLVSISAFCALIPLRIHTFTGQVWQNKTGFSAFFLKKIDKLISFFSTYLLADSKGQRKFLISNKIVNSYKIFTLGSGSISGVDMNRFKVDNKSRKKTRSSLGFYDSDIIFTYLGRVNYEKGIKDLILAFNKLSLINSKIRLLVVGDHEIDLKPLIKEKQKISIIKHTTKPELYLNITDVLCLPSYREGFGNCIIEAGAMQVPSIGSNIYGLKDTIIENKTGLKFEKGNIDQLFLAMKKMINKKLRKKYGLNAYKYVKTNFKQEKIINYHILFYKKILNI